MSLKFSHDAPLGQWQITLAPSVNFFLAGNDPLKLFKALAKLGQLEVQVSTKALPIFSDFDWQTCYLSWKLTLSAHIDHKTLQTLFESLSGDYHLEILQTSRHQAKALAITRIFSQIQSSREKEQWLPVNTEQLTTIVVDEDDEKRISTLLTALNNTHGQLEISAANTTTLSAENIAPQLDTLNDELTELEVSWQQLVSSQAKALIDELDQQLSAYCQSQGYGFQLEATGIEHILQKSTLAELKAVIVDNLGSLGATTSDTEDRIHIVIDIEREFDTVLIRLVSDGLPISNRSLERLERASIAFERVSTDLKDQIDIYLPAMVSLLEGDLIEIAQCHYLVPSSSIVETMALETDCIKLLSDKAELYAYQGRYLPIIRLQETLEGVEQGTSLDAGYITIIESRGGSFALPVERVLGQRSVLVNYFEHNYLPICGLAGLARIALDKRALIIDPAGLIKRYKNGSVASFRDKAHKGCAQDLDKAISTTLSSERILPFLVFSLAGDRYGIDLRRIEDITSWTALIPLPGTPSTMRGLLAWRQQLVPIIDLQARWSNTPQQIDAATPLLILSIREQQRHPRYVGLIVETIIDNYDVENGKMLSPPEIGHRFDIEQISGLVETDGILTVLFDIDRMLNQHYLGTIDAGEVN